MKIMMNKVVSLSEVMYMELWGDFIVVDYGFTNFLSAAMGVTASFVRIDSMVKYGVFVCGDMNMYFRFLFVSYREKVWDYVVGVIVV